MTAKTEFCLIITTTDERSEAESLAQDLVENMLAACVQISEIKSYYRWEDGVSDAAEFLLFIKTSRGRYEDIEEFLQVNHSYDVPEVVELPIRRGAAGYLNWIRASTAGGESVF